VQSFLASTDPSRPTSTLHLLPHGMVLFRCWNVACDRLDNTSGIRSLSATSPTLLCNIHYFYIRKS